MNPFNLQAVIRSKQAYHERLGQLPVAEKLAMLDTLRERALLIRAAAERARATDPDTLLEEDTQHP